jgi:hypothetical protein
MKTIFESGTDWKKLLAPRWIALALLIGVLLVLGLTRCQSTTRDGADAGQTLPGGWSGDCTVLN